MDTFPSITKQIIQEFDYEYPTVHSLQKILEKIELLPTEEKIKYISNIILIDKAIRDCGEENKRLTDNQVKKIITSISKGFELQIVSSKTFSETINEIVKNFNSKYTTIESLQQIILKIDDLSLGEKFGHKKQINLIKMTIKSYGNTKNRLLTNKEISKLFNIINHNYNPSFNNYTPSQKFAHDDIFSLVVLNLLTKLNNNVMGSTITVYVVDFFEIVNSILIEEPYKYEDLISEIEDRFHKHGWNNDSSEGIRGFQTEPFRFMMVEDLQEITNKYIEF